ncbi:phage Mu protein Gp25-like protein [Methanobrevibacter arboriphilus JCM 13429 = DSM 1125]|uniref:Phage Mu protein Gp25-like protein n=1 Tax=Methanobrevibacter arboriphilus JCM 13429 = DSM 1125 TaxID=1300164 RepID=A0A1V6N333_METAZ|nr:hypothetical protein [Methanobrevibacter arboriphilus]OQD59012.1 phage Mu protein Gp25-like protein [Methanobrevibacter arboriphilus JCM 13429 = DSM 1125]
MDYGTDLASHGRLDSKGQVSTVSGVYNVKQSLNNRLKTYKGTYSYIDEDYGSYLKDYVSLDDDKTNQSLVCLELETQCLKDERVESALATYENGEYKLNVILINGEELKLEDILW